MTRVRSTGYRASTVSSKLQLCDTELKRDGSQEIFNHTAPCAVKRGRRVDERIVDETNGSLINPKAVEPQRKATAMNTKKKPNGQTQKVRDLPTKKNPKGGNTGPHIGPSGPGG